MPRRALTSLALTTALAALVGCSPDRPTAPGALSAPASSRSTSTDATLVECTSSVTQSASGTITPLGGTVAVGNSRVSFPLNALPIAATVTLTVPASKFVEIEVTVNGAAHYSFQQPVTVAIDYSRCGRNDITKDALTAWNIDPVTKALLEPMGGTDDKTARTVTFTTTHFSGYAVAD